MTDLFNLSEYLNLKNTFNILVPISVGLGVS